MIAELGLELFPIARHRAGADGAAASDGDDHGCAAAPGLERLRALVGSVDPAGPVG